MPWAIAWLGELEKKKHLEWFRKKWKIKTFETLGEALEQIVFFWGGEKNCTTIGGQKLVPFETLWNKLRDLPPPQLYDHQPPSYDQGVLTQVWGWSYDCGGYKIKSTNLCLEASEKKNINWNHIPESKIKKKSESHTKNDKPNKKKRMTSLREERKF